MLVYVLNDSLEGVQLLKAARLQVESEQNEARITEEQHDERWRDGKSIFDLVLRQFVCFRFRRQ